MSLLVSLVEQDSCQEGFNIPPPIPWQADCYIFTPVVGQKLNVEIIKVGEKDLTVTGKIYFLRKRGGFFIINIAALKLFNVLIREVPSNRNLRAGQTVTIKILSVAYRKGVPYISGHLVSSLQVSRVFSSW